MRSASFQYTTSTGCFLFTSIRSLVVRSDVQLDRVLLHQCKKVTDWQGVESSGPKKSRFLLNYECCPTLSLQQQ